MRKRLGYWKRVFRAGVPFAGWVAGIVTILYGGSVLGAAGYLLHLHRPVFAALLIVLGYWLSLQRARTVWPAPSRPGHTKAIAESQAALEQANERLGVFENRLAIAKPQFGTELRDIGHKIEIVKSTRPNPHYSHGFQLPAARWDEYDEDMAAYPELYRVLDHAYTAAHHVNSALDMRRTRANPGVTLGVIQEDGLDAAYDAAANALDALGEPLGEVWESGTGEALRLVTEDVVQELAASREAIVALLISAIEQGQRLLERRVVSEDAWSRWLSDHGDWRELVNGEDGALKAELPAVDYHRVNDMSELPDSVPVGEFDYNADHARSRVYIDRRLRNLNSVLRDYRDQL
ncbi:MAG: hypothetical protein ACXVZN_06700 [Gaiellaceae bacterium]